MGRDKIHQPYITVSGQKVPSVTQIIGHNLGWNTQALLGWTRAKMKQGIDPIRLRDFAGEVGTVAHGLVEQELTGDMFNIYEYPAEAVTAAQVAYAAFQSFQSTNDLKTESVEIPIVHEDLLYGGTIDWIGNMNGERCMIDFKTSSNVYPTHFVQLAAYRELYTHQFGEELGKAYILHMDKKTGNHALHVIVEFEKYWQTFEHLLALQTLYDEIGG